MQQPDPRWRRFWRNLAWFVATMVVLVILFRFYPSFVVLLALWGVGLVWGGLVAYKLSQLFFGGDAIAASEERSWAYLEQALDYKAKISSAIKTTSGPASQVHLRQLAAQIDAWVEAIDALVQRIGSLRQDEVLRRDLQTVPQAIKDLEARLASETDTTIHPQLERALANRRKQLESLEALQVTIKRAEIQIESTLSQLGTIYSQILTGQSTSDVANYNRLSVDVDEEMRLLQDHLEALREVKLGTE